MIEPLYPLLDKQYVLFNEYLDALLTDTLRVNVDKDNMSYFYCYSENMEDIYTVKFHLTFNGIGIHIIVYWDGKRMLYQNVSSVLNVDYEPKKSLKDTCLELIEGAYTCAEEMLDHSYYERERKCRIMTYISDLRTTLNKIEDNT